MKIKQLLEAKKGVRAVKHTVKPRNFVAKNAMATTSGAGAHKDKKKAAKQGDVKHKKKDMELAEASLDEYGDTAKGQKMLTKVQKRAVDRMIKADDKRDAKSAKKNQDTANRAWDRMTDKDLEEGHYRRPGSPTAYDRDYASSISGMGKKDSLAYQMDGGANDEGWDEEPRGKYQAPEDKPVLLGYYFYNVQPGQEDQAAIYGVKQTKSGKWAKAKYSTSGRSFGMQKDGADRVFGPGKWWAPK